MHEGLRVGIHGEGIASRCCAHLLVRGNCEVSVERTPRPSVPVIMIADNAANLIRDAFDNHALLRGLPRISKRIVLWGADAVPVTLEHSAVVVSEEQLLAGLGNADPTDLAPDWTIHSASAPSGATKQSFGTRTASTAAVQLRDSAEANACWIESMPTGWLFAITISPGSAWLVAVGGDPLEMLGNSRLVATRVDQVGAPGGRFPCSPRMLSPVCGPRWLACGSAAIGFDPICGDGTAHAVREAILASATIRAIANGGDQAALLRHYQSRLLAGFRKHLEMCLAFYESGGDSPWWREQVQAVLDGIAWCNRQPPPENAFRLNGFDLEPVG